MTRMCQTRMYTDFKIRFIRVCWHPRHPRSYSESGMQTLKIGNNSCFSAFQYGNTFQFNGDGRWQAINADRGAAGLAVGKVFGIEAIESMKVAF